MEPSSPTPDVPSVPTSTKTDTSIPFTIKIIYSGSGESRVIKPCLANIITLLRYDTSWLGVLTFNEFSGNVTVKRQPPGWNYKVGEAWTDTDDGYAANWFQSKGIYVSSALVSEGVDIVARENAFHPVRDYLKKLKWDGVPRVEKWLIRYLGADDLEVNQQCGKMWLLGAIARVMIPGAQVDHTLLLEGEQGIRKSTALRILASDNWFTDHISDFRDKDARLDLMGKWIIELSELQGVKGNALEVVKSFLTSRIDHFRSPYGRRTQAHQRQCVFAATTNDFSSLTDETGNRRFWPIRCTTIDIKGLAEDRNQLWAEAFHLYQAGEKWWPNENLADLLRAAQRERYEPGPEDETILVWAANPTPLGGWQYVPGDPEPTNPLVSKPGKVILTEVLQHGLALPIGERSKWAHTQSIVRCLKSNGWKPYRKTDEGGSKRYWVAP